MPGMNWNVQKDVYKRQDHGKGVECLEDVIWWDNPRRHKRFQDPKTGRWIERETNATTGDKLYKILCTFQRKYEMCIRDSLQRVYLILISLPDAPFLDFQVRQGLLDGNFFCIDGIIGFPDVFIFQFICCQNFLQ